MSNLGTYFKTDPRHRLLVLERLLNRRGLLIPVRNRKKLSKKKKKRKIGIYSKYLNF